MRKAPNDESIQQLRERVAAEPFDLSLRYELGVALYRRGDVRSAIPELQRAREHPNCRFEATSLLVEIFRKLGMHGVARRLRRSADDDEPPDPDSGSAPRPSPLHPITPLVGLAAKQLPTDPTGNA